MTNIAWAIPFPSTSGMPNSVINKTAFPGTISDIPRDIRHENITSGYLPYKDASAYSSISVESEEEALDRQLRRLQAENELDKLNLTFVQYCDKYPLDDAYGCPQTPDLEQQIIAIGNSQTSAAQPNTSPSVSAPTQTTPTTSISNIISAIAPAAPTPTPTPTPTTGTFVASNKIHDGPCTPSAISNNFRNKILTTGKYENIDAAFEKAMVQIFRVEGDCGGHPNDPGGYTCYGYAQNFNPDIDVRQLTRGGAEDRTYERFYKAKNIDRLPDAIRGDVLRGDFGSGPGAGIKKLQRTLGMAETGRVDDALITAAENYPGDLHDEYWNTMQQFYIDITQRKPERKVFLKGWMNGVKHFRENGCHVVPLQPLTR